MREHSLLQVIVHQGGRVLIGKLFADKTSTITA